MIGNLGGLLVIEGSSAKTTYKISDFLWNAKFSQGLWRDNEDNVGRDENLIKILLCHFCLVQKQCDFAWNAKFSQ